MSLVSAQAPFCFRHFSLFVFKPSQWNLVPRTPTGPVNPSPRRQDSVATIQEQTANTIPDAEGWIAGPGAGSAVSVKCGPCPIGRAADLAKAARSPAQEMVSEL